MMKRTPIKDLSCAAIDVKPMDYDWQAGYGEAWEVIYPDVDDWTRAQCVEWLDDKGQDTDGDDDALRESVRIAMQDEDYAFMPMMNYAYPLPGFRGDPAKAQSLLDQYAGSVCIVAIGDDSFLALTGGGMDLSWEICEAYMLLGYLPPVHFCGLPDYAGCRLTSKARWVIAGCKRSCHVMKNWCDSRLRELAAVRKSAAANAR